MLMALRLIRVLLLALGAIHFAPCVAQSRPPNVLFVAIDDLNDWLGCLQGHPGTKTPNIDRLAARGTLFSNAYCQTALCGPSRASLMTGRLPSSTGIYAQLNNRVLGTLGGGKDGMTYLSQWFAANGYRTMGTGKIFHGGAPKNAFDEWGEYGGFGPRPAEKVKWLGKGTSTDWLAFPERDEQMPDFRSAAWGVERLQAEYDRPFFLAIGFCRPHVPWYVPQKWFDLHPLESIELPPYLPGDQDDVPEISRRAHEVPMMPTAEWAIEKGEWKPIVQAYLACISFVDAQVGKLLDALDASSYADDTIVVLWSDHGYHIGEKNRFAKHGIWREATRTPLIFAGPGITHGMTRGVPVGLIDIYPTLLELCGLPANPANDGHSLCPLLAQGDVEWPWPVLSFWGFGNTAVALGQHRYVLWEDGSEELYDIAADPDEWNNLADDPATAELRRALATHVPSEPATWRGPPYRHNDYFRSSPTQRPVDEPPAGR
jgi:arylsulfatase A-like enzyme